MDIKAGQSYNYTVDYAFMIIPRITNERWEFGS